MTATNTTENTGNESLLSNQSAHNVQGRPCTESLITCGENESHGNTQDCANIEKKKEVRTMAEEPHTTGFLAKLSKCMKINKPLVPLKISLFLWFGAVATATPFLQVYFIQLGITVSQLSIIYSIIPIVEFFGRVVSGILADKLGHSKPVLLSNLLLIGLVLSGMLLIPPVNKTHCNEGEITIQCIPEQSVQINCKQFNSLSIGNCHYLCQGNKTEKNENPLCAAMNQSTCDVRSTEETEFFIEIKQSNDSTCFIDITHSSSYIVDLCHLARERNCNLSCKYHVDERNATNIHQNDLNCEYATDNASLTLTLGMISLILYYTFMSTCYAIMDVTSMSMANEHNSHFGRERFWSILSIVVMSTFAGYLVNITTPVNAPKNCSVAFYLFDVLIIITMVSVYKLDVKINPRSRDMLRQTLQLVKNFDILAFALVVLILGCSFYFTRIFSFIYLNELGASALLLGLIPAVSSLSGLPFLLTSSWWVRKIGTANLIVLGCFGYAFLCVGYSLILNPWYALIFEVAPVFTYHLLWVAVIQRSHEIAPEGLTATVISSAGALHYAVGKGGGSLVGGLVMGEYGAPTAYQAIASLCFATGVLYGFYQCLIGRRRSHSQQSTQVPQQ